MHKFQVLRPGLKAICAVPASDEYHSFFGWYYWMLCRSGTTLIVWGTARMPQRLDERCRIDEVRAVTEAGYLLARRKRNRNCNTKRLELRIRPLRLCESLYSAWSCHDADRTTLTSMAFLSFCGSSWHANQRQTSSSARRRNLVLRRHRITPLRRRLSAELFLSKCVADPGLTLLQCVLGAAYVPFHVPFRC